MKREEAKEKCLDITFYDDGNSLLLNEEANELIDQIYDDFESRICSNCKYFQPNKIEDLSSGYCTFIIKGMDANDGCIKGWRAKDVTEKS